MSSIVLCRVSQPPPSAAASRILARIHTRCMHAYIHLCAHVCTHVYTHVCTHVRTHVCTHVYTHVCVHVCTHVCTHVYMPDRTQCRRPRGPRPLRECGGAVAQEHCPCCGQTAFQVAVAISATVAIATSATSATSALQQPAQRSQHSVRQSNCLCSSAVVSTTLQ